MSTSARTLKKIQKISFLALLVINLAVIGGLWWQKSGSLLLVDMSAGFLYIMLGRLFGLLAEYFVLVQLLLIGRITWVEQGFGFDRLNLAHRFIGQAVIVFFVLHPVFLALGYSTLGGVGFWAQVWEFLTQWEHVLLAFFGLLIFVGVIALSVAIVRRKLRYETWYFTHLSLYVAIFLTFQHQIESGDLTRGGALVYWLALNFTVFGLVLLYRWLRPLWLLWRHGFYVAKIVRETADVYSVYIRGRDIEKFRFQSGQYANLTFLARGLWFTHPFSFSAAPNGQYLRFSMKVLGDFTSRIPRLPLKTRVIIDGPLGVFTEAAAVKDKFLLVGGGIGITPLRALAESLLARKKDVELLYGARTEQDMTFMKELEALGIDYWCVMSDDVAAKGGDRGRGAAKTAAEKYETGYIDQEKIERLVPDFRKRSIFLCGPTAMMKAVSSTLRSLGVPKNQIHFEKFSF